jgi:hypothetical protein
VAPSVVVCSAQQNTSENIMTSNHGHGQTQSSAMCEWCRFTRTQRKEAQIAFVKKPTGDAKRRMRFDSTNVGKKKDERRKKKLSQVWDRSTILHTKKIVKKKVIAMIR